MENGRSEGGWRISPGRVAILAAIASSAVIFAFSSLHEETLRLDEAIHSLGSVLARNQASLADPFPAVIRHSGRIALTAAIVSLAFLGGGGLTRWLGVDTAGLLRLLTRAGLGLGVGALGVFALGLAGILYPMLIAGGAVALAVPSLPGNRRKAGPVRDKQAAPWWMWAAGASLAATVFVASLSPEFFFDSLVYHLALPERFLAVHKFPVMEYNFLTFLPLNTEMLYTPCLAFGGEECAKLLNFSLGIMCALSAALLAREMGGGAPAWAGAGAFFLVVSMPLSIIEGEMTFADNSRGLWESLALLWLLRSRGRGARGLLLAGAFIGLAMGSKYLSYIRGALILAVLVATVLARRGGVRGFLRAAAPFAAAAALMALPWLARNWLCSRDPLYPFGSRLMDGINWGGFEHARWMQDNRSYGVSSLTPLRWLTLPWRVTLDAVQAEFGTLTTGPLLLGLAVVPLLARGWPWAVRAAAAIFALEAVFWSLSSHLVRYLLPGLIAWCAVLGWGIGRLRASVGRPFILIVAVMAAWWGNSLVSRAHHLVNLEDSFSLVSLATGRMDPVEYVRGRIFAGNERLLPPGRILLVGESRVLGFGRVWVASSQWNRPVLENWARESADVRRLSIKARQAGIRGVVLNTEYYSASVARGDFNLPPARMEVLGAWWKSLGVVFRYATLIGYAVPPFPRNKGRMGTP